MDLPSGLPFILKGPRLSELFDRGSKGLAEIGRGVIRAVCKVVRLLPKEYQVLLKFLSDVMTVNAAHRRRRAGRSKLPDKLYDLLSPRVHLRKFRSRKTIDNFLPHPFGVMSGCVRASRLPPREERSDDRGRRARDR